MAWWNRTNIQLPAELYQQAEAAAAHAGYATVAEFVEHCVRKQLESAASDDDVLQGRLRGLGYVD